MASRPPARRNALLAGTMVTTVLACIAVVDLSPVVEAHNTRELIALDAGWSRACVQTTAGGVQCWGAIYGTTTVDIPDLMSGVAEITVGGAHACVVTSSTRVRCWGANAEGQLGDRSFDERSSPVQVVGLENGVSSVAAGGFFTCSVKVDSNVACWGDNSQGQLGDGTSGDYQNRPVDVMGLTGATAIATGDNHACAITTPGVVVCWGSDSRGQLGDNAMGGLRPVPAPVSGLTGVTALALGADHSCAVAMDAAKCWGANGGGQLGNGTTIASSMPVQVSGLSSGVTALAAGNGHTCALMTTGAVKCWGANDYGQLGDGTTTDRRTPIDVLGLSSGTAGVTAGSGFSCALARSGETTCWGLNDSGQLGDGTLTQRLTPVDVVIEAKATPLPAPTPPSEEGDANCDGRVDSVDAAVILQYGASLIDSAGCPASADANDDGAIDSRDAALVLQYIAGLTTL